VLRLARPVGDELNRLLGACNGVVAQMEQPLLYGNADKGEDGPDGRETGNLRSGPASRKGKKPPATVAGCSLKHAAVEDRSHYFHISIAWMLQDPGRRGDAAAATAGTDDNDLTQIEKQNVMEVPFDAVKVKIGNAVHDIPLAKATYATAAAAAIKH
jgi:U6 snRNA phosphodiesterase